MSALFPLLFLIACDPRPGGDAAEPWESPDARPSLTVRVVDVDGAGVAAIWVSLSPSGRDAQTDAFGRAHLERLPDDAVQVVVAGAQPVSARPAVGGAEVTVRLAAPEPTLSGTVHGPDGQPVVGAEVHAGGQVAHTDADGRYALHLLPGPVFVEVFADGLLQSAVDLDLAHQAWRALDWTLSGVPPDLASFTGSTACAACHPSEGAAWADTAHATASRVPSGDDPLASAFLTGTSLTLPGGAQLFLGATTPDAWWVEVAATGETTGRMPVRHVYGTGRRGSALAVDWEGSLALPPVLWAGAGGGLGPDQPDAGFVVRWADTWVAADGELVADPAGVSFDLRCGGCHTTGHRLVESRGDFALVSAEPAERVVGCEACHGPGSVHRRRADRRGATILNPAHMGADVRTQVCAGCHAQRRAEDHPFSSEPAWVVQPDGQRIAPWRDDGVGASDWWRVVPASRVLADQVSELQAGPHGTGAFAGRCEDCHDPHGSAHTADLHADPWDNAVCMDCHRADLPDDEAITAHAGHDQLSVGAWEPGSCVGCHMPRSAHVARPDVLTGAGEDRAHGLRAWTPSDLLAEFDAANATSLPHGDVPVIGCLDCHIQRHAEARADGGGCACPQGDPGLRLTYERLAEVFAGRFGSTP